MNEPIAIALLTLGAVFSMLAGVGILRMPDLFMRIQAATKAGALGIVCLFLAVAVYFQDLAVTTRSLLVISFIFITAPVAAHMIGRAAYIVGVKPWEHNIRDDLRGRYDPRTHTLESARTDRAKQNPDPTADHGDR